MTKFIAIFSSPRSEISKFMKMPEAKRKMAMEEENMLWTAWFKKNKKSIVDPGDVFGKTKQVMRKGIKDIKNDLTGYTVVKAATHDAAAKMFKDNPQLRSGKSKIEIMALLGFMSK